MATFPTLLSYPCELEWTHPMKAFQTWILMYTSDAQDHSIKIYVPFKNLILKDTQYWEDIYVPRYITHISTHTSHVCIQYRYSSIRVTAVFPKENGVEVEVESDRPFSPYVPLLWTHTIMYASPHLIYQQVIHIRVSTLGFNWSH
jgi:hypothetical protein